MHDQFFREHAPAPPRLLPRRVRESLHAYAYLLPAAAVLLVFWFLPIFLSALLSLTNWRGGDTADVARFVGLSNYRRALADQEFRQSLYNTINYALLTVPLTLAAGLGAALLLNRPLRGVGLFRTLSFLPYVTTWVAIAIVFRVFFDREFGLANQALAALHLPWRPTWLDEPRGLWELLIGALRGRPQFRIPPAAPLGPLLAGPSLAMTCLIAASVWRGAGLAMVVYLAGLQTIDPQVHEAASIDGAGAWARFRCITLPLLRPTTFFLTVVTLIDALKAFVPTLVMTPNGGPAQTTSTVVFYLYRVGFSETWEMGYASAVAYILLGLILALTLIQMAGRK
ncbi:MAG: sugar ABC transporter permease [Candidatus Sumerlaeota bacterium]|nr:sugar ABC transporter permease [Candidatus Sumerlaeota bacterium]